MPGRSPVSLVHRRVTESFFKMLLYSHDDCYRLWIISPWIAPLAGHPIPLAAVCRHIDRLRIPTYIITRPPQFDFHIRSLEMLSSCRTTEILLFDQLHAKMYVAENQQMSTCLIASANLTGYGLEGVVVGVLIRGSGFGKDLVEDAIQLASRIRGMTPHKRVKYFNEIGFHGGYSPSAETSHA